MLYVLESLPYLVLFIFGTVIGSFLNVCIYRLPLGQSVVTAPSHCMSCGEKLRWYDMVPVVSWLVLGGKCRNCKSKISIQYPLIEAVNGLLYVGVCMVTGLNLTGMVYCLMASAMLTLSVIDFRRPHLHPLRRKRHWRRRCEAHGSSRITPWMAENHPRLFVRLHPGFGTPPDPDQSLQSRKSPCLRALPFHGNPSFSPLGKSVD